MKMGSQHHRPQAADYEGSVGVGKFAFGGSSGLSLIDGQGVDVGAPSHYGARLTAFEHGHDAVQRHGITQFVKLQCPEPGGSRDPGIAGCTGRLRRQSKSEKC